jgi:CRISPR-associated protein Csx3
MTLSTVRIGFGEPSTNDRIVPDALAVLARLNLSGERGMKFNGPASLPLAMAIAHAIAHLFRFVAVFDPKLQKYVVAIDHDYHEPLNFSSSAD